MKHHVGQTRNGIPVYVDLITSYAAKRIALQPSLLILAKEALRKKSPRGPSITVEYDMGRPIGYSSIVDTGEKDAVFYAQLLQDDVYTRFVKSGKPTATQYLTLRLTNDGEAYHLHDIWIGKVAPPRPGASDEAPESKDFWTSHAFVFANQQLKMRTTTKECPY